MGLAEPIIHEEQERVAPSLVFSLVPKTVVDVVWDDISRVLKRSVETAVGKFDIGDLRAGVESDVYVLWVVMDGSKIIAAIATKVIKYPRRKALSLEWVGGTRMKEWGPMVHTHFIDIAKKNGCEHLEGYGRKAWGFLGEKYGWKQEYIAFRLELDHG